MRQLVIVAHARTCGRFIVGCTRWSMQCWYDVKASASGSCGPLVTKKRRRKPYTVLLGKSRGKDRTVLPNAPNANEYSLATSEQGPVLARALEFGVCSGGVVSRFVVL